MGADEVAFELAGFVEPARGGDALSMVAEEGRFVIEGVDVRGSAGGENEDDTICLRAVMGGLWGERIKRPGGGCSLGFLKKSCEREGAEAAGRPLKPFPSGERVARIRNVRVSRHTGKRWR